MREDSGAQVQSRFVQIEAGLVVNTAAACYLYTEINECSRSGTGEKGEIGSPCFATYVGNSICAEQLDC